MIARATVFIVLVLASANAGASTVTVTADNTRITQSCTIMIPPQTVIADTDGNGVIQIAADDIDVRFADGSELCGCPRETKWDQMTGIGIRIDGHKNVTVENAHIRGYKVGISASNCDRLRIFDSNFADNFRQHLRSTPEKEDQRDWLSFHHNDNDEAVNNYGAAIFVKSARNIDIHNVRVRTGQNGIMLSRVDDSKIYDNDCSFLSGWGLAMWRCFGNSVGANRFDFCVRGFSDGVYNRGQDSAGIIAFEQCSKNLFALNSVTHGGDGFFAFAGVEALGSEKGGENAPKDFDYTRKGCNDNLLFGNDFSDCVAHGVEITFSFGNQIIRNYINDNAICGIWGGFSQQSLIAENVMERNGAFPLGLERGAIDIDHCANSVILGNTLVNNRCGVHIWWHPAPEIENSPWGKANYLHPTNVTIVQNNFTVDDKLRFANLGADEKVPLLQLRDESQPAGKMISDIRFFENKIELKNPRAVEILATPGIDVIKTGKVPVYYVPQYEEIGSKKVVLAHPELRGRDKIKMNDWGPIEAAETGK